MPFNLGFGELLVVMVVALLVFGGRLPQMGKSLGQGLRQFKNGLSGSDDDPDDSPVELPSGPIPAVEEEAGKSATGLLDAPPPDTATSGSETEAAEGLDATPRPPAP